MRAVVTGGADSRSHCATTADHGWEVLAIDNLVTEPKPTCVISLEIRVSDRAARRLEIHRCARPVDYVCTSLAGQPRGYLKLPIQTLKSAPWHAQLARLPWQKKQNIFWRLLRSATRSADEPHQRPTGQCNPIGPRVYDEAKRSPKR